MNIRVGSDGTVGKALEVLDAIAAFERPVRFSELLESSSFPKATLYRLVQVLTNQGMLSFEQDSGTYSIGSRVVRLAHTAWKNASLAPIARRYVEELSASVGENVHLAQIDNGQVLFVDKVKSNNRIETMAKVGMVAPAYCTGVGKVMMAFMAPKRLEIVLQQQSYYRYTKNSHAEAAGVLAELDTIRAEGFAYDREEHEDGIISIAAPILTSSGGIIGAVSIATSTSHLSLHDLNGFKPQLLTTAKSIGEEATSWQFPS